jgi:soluble lytic murein transglycosylase-like protein
LKICRLQLVRESQARGRRPMRLTRILALASVLTWTGAARAEVMEIGADGSVKVLRDSPDSAWSSNEAEPTADDPDGIVIPDAAVTTLKDNGWSGPYAQALVEVARANDISPHLLEAVVWQESRWNAAAVSRVGAIGLAQLMPGTARDLGVDPKDPIQNLSGGARYLRQQLNRFDGNVEKALAAYNAGPGRVMTAGGIPSIPETQAYVRAIVARLAANSIKEGKLQ